jgi:hypothetical protein
MSTTFLTDTHVFSEPPARKPPPPQKAKTTTNQTATPPGSPNAKRQRRLDEQNMTAQPSNGNPNPRMPPQSHDAPQGLDEKPFSEQGNRHNEHNVLK